MARAGSFAEALGPMMARAVAAHREGRLAAAIGAYREVLRRYPGFAEAHNNLGVALKAAGRTKEAVASLRAALALRADYAMAHANLASTLTALGQRDEALRHWFHAVRLDPASLANRQGMAAALRPMRFREAAPAVVEGVRALLEAEGIDHQQVAVAAVSLLKLDSHVADALRIVAEGTQGLDGDHRRSLAANELLKTLLCRVILADSGFERLQACLRRQYLAEAVAGAPSPPAPTPSDPEAAFMAALAIQFFRTEYVAPETAEESEQAAELERRLVPCDRLGSAAIVLAMYRPLHRLDAARGWSTDGLAAPLAALLRVQVAEPLAERTIAAALPALTPIDAPVSRAVQQQYEENPYPRWITTRQAVAKPLGRVLRELFPHLQTTATPSGRTRILVAGCGTGKHAIEVATRFADAEVLAVDLSLASLAYGARKAQELALRNLRFAQADILSLGGIGRFELIEAGGVLHHMADPLSGWRVLAGLLASGGVMRLGFYSAHARRHIEAARGLVQERGFAADPAGIRAARAAILALGAEDPRRSVASELDFHSLSGCRDLLFHVQEQSFTLPQLGAMIEELGLEFLGFEFLDPAPRIAYARRFPDDGAATSLANWDAFEREAPATFHNMYQFWCRKS